jgi:hypothetical protein
MGSVPTKVKENNNICALFRAIKEEKFERAKTLIYAGTAIDCINYDGSTPLIETCRNSRRYNDDREREKFVMFLIENGCDVSKSDIYGWNAGLDTHNIILMQSSTMCYSLVGVTEKTKHYIKGKEFIDFQKYIHSSQTDFFLFLYVFTLFKLSRQYIYRT